MRLPRRRRLEAKTDYKSRLTLLKSNKARLVVRKTNRYLISQIVQSEIAQDKVVVGFSSNLLLSQGWPKENSGSLKNKAAAYLTGYLLADLAIKKGIKEAILDLGMNRNVHKSRLYALVKGAIDCGLKIACDPKALPTKEDIEANKKFVPIILKLTK